MDLQSDLELRRHGWVGGLTLQPDQERACCGQEGAGGGEKGLHEWEGREKKGREMRKS